MKSFVKAIRKKKKQLKVHAVGITMDSEYIVCVCQVFLPNRRLLWRSKVKRLKIRHDSYDRAAYMPGVAIAVT